MLMAENTELKGGDETVSKFYDVQHFSIEFALSKFLHVIMMTSTNDDNRHYKCL